MLLIMGEGTKEKSKEHSDPFNLFVDLVYRAYLASRDHMDAIYPVVEVMIQSGLPCFKPEVMKNLRYRFSDNLNEQEAVDFMKKKVDSSYENVFSYVYDKFQELFEGVRG
jgi:phosphatidylinositol 4-kinase A